MTNLVQFGSYGTKIYTFPTVQEDYNDNFANLVPSTQRMPGMTGGLDEYGDDPAPGEIGNVTFSFTITSTTRSGMTAKLDTLRKTVEWGTQWLYLQPSDPLLALRRCRARVNNISSPKRFDKHTDLWQRVTMNFQASDPRWYGPGTEAPTWGDSTVLWGGSSKWGGGAVPTALTGGVESTVTVNNTGAMIAHPRLTFEYVSGTPTQVFSIIRYVGGVAVESMGVNLTTPLTTNETLEINTRAYSVLRYASGIASDAYYGFSYTHPEWLRLDPGNNDVRLFVGSGAYNAYIRFYEVYV